MGRTHRTRRKRKSSTTCNQYLNGNPVVINLTKWMCKNNWTNDTRLSLKEFPDTGRGITSKHASFKQNDVLINIPYRLMISFNTLEDSSDFRQLFAEVDNTFTIQELLALYLALEKHKNEQSFWQPYIASLPVVLPELPWLLSPTINLPNDIKSTVDEQRSRFLAAWSKISQSIRENSVLTLDLFRWCYVTVNTRGVYVNPSTVRRRSTTTLHLQRFLSDDPSMALCPYLDMFNHCTAATTNASLDDNDLTFRLVTQTAYCKHQQVFISYGEHDNDKLMCEYGFFIDGNKLDCVRFKIQDIMELLGGKNCTKLQYNHVKSLDLEELSVRPMEVSYTLKQVLFVLSRPYLGVNIWNSVTFSERYTAGDMRDINDVVQTLLKSRICLLNDELDKLIDVKETAVVLNDFIKYKIQFCLLCYDSFGRKK